MPPAKLKGQDEKPSGAPRLSKLFIGLFRVASGFEFAADFSQARDPRPFTTAADRGLGQEFERSFDENPNSTPKLKGQDEKGL